MSARVILPGKRYAGYIFDLDGTLVDSMPTHYAAWRWALQKHGAPENVFRWDEFVAHGGMAAPDIVADLNNKYGLQMEPELVAEESEDKSKTWMERKNATIAHLKVASKDVQMIGLADKLSNMRDIARDYPEWGEDLWNRFRMRDKKVIGWYYKSIRESLRESLGDTNPYKEYSALIDENFE